MEHYKQYPRALDAVQEWDASTKYEHEIHARAGGCLTMLSVDLPEGVELIVQKDKTPWFRSTGNEKGTLKFCGIPFDILSVEIDNTNASAQLGHVRIVYQT